MSVSIWVIPGEISTRISELSETDVLPRSEQASPNPLRLGRGEKGQERKELTWPEGMSWTLVSFSQHAHCQDLTLSLDSAYRLFQAASTSLSLAFPLAFLGLPLANDRL